MLAVQAFSFFLFAVIVSIDEPANWIAFQTAFLFLRK